jgi:hypothetical protein
MYTELKIQRAALANEGRILKTEGMSALKRGRTILGIDRRRKKHEPDEEHPLKDKPFKHRTLKIATGQIDETGKAVLREAVKEEVEEAAEHVYSQYQGYYDQRMIIRKESRIAHLVHTLLTERPYPGCGGDRLRGTGLEGNSSYGIPSYPQDQAQQEGCGQVDQEREATSCEDHHSVLSP